MTLNEPVRIIGKGNDYLRFYCPKCDQPVKSEFLGLDPMVPSFQFSCSSCGESHEFKIEMDGIKFMKAFNQVD